MSNKPIKENALKCARLLYRLILKHNPIFKIKPHHGRTWAADIEKINRIDGHSYIIIEEVIKWCQEDDFWQKNILSGFKLRKQFNLLTTKMGGKKAKAMERKKEKEVYEKKIYEKIMAEKNKDNDLNKKITAIAKLKQIPTSVK